MLFPVVHSFIKNQHRRRISVVAMCVFVGLVCLLVVTVNASPMPQGSALSVRAPSSLSVIEKRWEASAGKLSLYAGAMSAVGTLAYQSCSAPVTVPTALVCVGSALVVIIGSLAGIWRALTRDVGNISELYHLHPGNETHSPVGQMVATLAPYEEHLVAYHLEDASMTKYAVYFRHDPDVGTKMMRAKPQGKDFLANLGKRQATGVQYGNAGGVYVDYIWKSVNVNEERDFGNDEGDMDGLMADMLSSGEYTAQGLFCMNYFEAAGNADQGLVSVYQDTEYPWQPGQSDALLNSC